MKPFALLLLAILYASSAVAPGQAQPKNPYPTMAPVEQYLMPSAADEIALSRTAAPPSVSAKATVLVLDKHGYQVAVRGTNGWTCFVERAWTGGFDDPEFWNPKSRAPNCFNPPAVRSVLPQYVARAKWAFAGATREQLAVKAKAAYASHQFTDPAPGAFSFMMSKKGYLNDQTAGPWHPHIMPFISSAQIADWSAGWDGSPVLIGTGFRVYEPVTIFIIVRHWSDGSPDLPHR